MPMYKCTDCHCDTPNKKDLHRLDGSFLCSIHRCDACQKRFELELDFQSEGETIMETELICPWCGFVYEPYEAWEIEDGTGIECTHCGQHFDLETETRKRYSTKRSLCDMPEDYGKEESK